MCMMEAQLNLVKINGENKGGDKSKLHEPLLMPGSDAAQTGSLSEVAVCSVEAEGSSCDVSVNTSADKPSGTDVSVNTSADKPSDAPLRPKPGGTRAAPVEPDRPKPKPKPLRSLLSPSTGTCTVHHVSQSFTSTRRESLQTTAQTEEEDLCAAVLLACLFCHPLDCLVAAVRGFHLCSLSLCSWLCGCEPATLRPLLDATHRCDACGCLGARCVMCDCPVCDICLQATECLDLAMEISQMLYH